MVKNQPPPVPRILLVDDNEAVLTTLTVVLKANSFEVTTAANVNDALRLIGSQAFDVLLTDLQMPGAGDGLIVASAMRHSNPYAVTIILSGYPEMKEAAKAILLHTDQILIKPMDPDTLIDVIRERLKHGAPPAQTISSVADVLERDTHLTINDWLRRVDQEPHILTIHLADDERTAHLPELFVDLIDRLRKPLPLGTHALESLAAENHGRMRRAQGYSAAMMVEESRMLQVSIFQTLQNNLKDLDYNVLLADVMTIADEVDSQLTQSMACYVEQSMVDDKVVEA